MKFRFIEENRDAHEVGLMCRVLDVSRSGFYAWEERPPSDREKESTRLLDQIRVVHAESRRLYGAPRVHAELVDRGEGCGRKRVARLMRQAGIQARTVRRYRVTTESNHRWPVAPNLLKRCFEATKPNRVWIADITYVRTWEGWMYLAAIVDVFSRYVVGWAMDKSISADLTLSALRMALAGRRPGHGLIHHSDRGGQYACDDYRELLKDHGARASMSRKGDCWDNAAMESFYHTVKTELVALETFRTRAEASRAVFEYIEVYYNRQRRHSTLGYLSPAEFERRAT
jgi:putative transposase